MTGAVRKSSDATKAKSLLRRRRSLLRRAGRKEEIQAIYVSKREDVSYLSGFSGEDAALLLTKSRSILVTDFRFGEQAPRECLGTEVHVRPRNCSLEVATARLLEQQGIRKLGFQGLDLSFSRHDRLKKRMKRRRLIDLDDIFSAERAVKNDDEIRRTRRAVRIAEKAFRELLGQGARYVVGRTERQLADELETRMRDAGADRSAFDIIVAAGPNSSMCHYRPGSRLPRSGEGLLFDWGAEVDGYRSDMTRVVFIESVPPKMREIYAIVLKAHEVSRRAMRPGARCDRIHRLADHVIQTAGYGDYFGHGLGHGIGLEIHEQPRLSAESKTILRKNMIVTVEPGIYLPGIGGVRIEDDILITQDGHERLNTLPRKLESMILR